jgi:hypothetical protein
MAEREIKETRRPAAGEARETEQGQTEDKAARARTKAMRRRARSRRKDQAVPPAAKAGGRPGHDIEARLARLEDAVASQAERSEKVISKLDEVLREARKSARAAKDAVEPSAE